MFASEQINFLPSFKKILATSNSSNNQNIFITNEGHHGSITELKKLLDRVKVKLIHNISEQAGNGQSLSYIKRSQL